MEAISTWTVEDQAMPGDDGDSRWKSHFKSLSESLLRVWLLTQRCVAFSAIRLLEFWYCWIWHHKFDKGKRKCRGQNSLRHVISIIDSSSNSVLNSNNQDHHFIFEWVRFGVIFWFSGRPFFFFFVFFVAQWPDCQIHRSECADPIV